MSDSNQTIKFIKTRDVQSPSRAHKTDAGIDFYVPNDLKMGDIILSDIEEDKPISLFEAIKEGIFSRNKYSTNSFVVDDRGYGSYSVKEIILQPNQRILFPAGVKVKIPENTALIFFNKSGVSTKCGLDLLSCVIDYGYEGEVKIGMVNTSKTTQVIKAGAKIVQGVLLPVLFNNVEECTNANDVLYKSADLDKRSEGGFGSTGA